MPIPPLYPRSRSMLGSKNPKGSTSRAPKDFGKNKSRLKRPWWAYVIVVAIIFLLIGGIGMVGAFAYFSKELPNPDKINDRSVAESTRIYARDETTLLYEIHGDIRRTVIPIDEIPDFAINATIAVEDKTFFTHSGFSLTGIVKAVCHEVVGNLGGLCPQRGGSTITQQFIKNAVLTSERTYTRKIKELVLAYQMESKFSKDQILQLYFNEIPYGSNVYGIQSASQYYFNKDVQKLTLDEAALLAALPQAPTYYSPHGNNTELLVGRQKLILDLLAEQGYITNEEAEEAKAVDVLAKVSPPREAILAPHFVLYVKEYLIEKYGEAVVERGGLRVVTTLEPTLQQYAEQAVAEYGERNQTTYNASNAALVSLNPITGQILAMVGSRDYFNTDIDGNVNVALRTRNPGSSFKPFVYTTAFTKGYTPDTMLFDLKTNFGPQGDGTNYVPNNYDGGERGPITMRNALQGSLNIPAVKTLYLAGIPSVVELAKKAGYTTIGEPDQYGLALALGGAGVNLLEHTAAFGVFAQEGMHRKPQAVLKVLDHKGKILEQFSTIESEAVDKNIANMTANILSDNDARAYIFGSRSKLYIPGRQVGVKTGTTNDWRDGWTVGFTPSLVAGVWVGNNDNSVMARGADGSFVATPIWNSYMQKALSGAPQERFPSYTPPKTDKPILNGDLEGESILYVDSVTGEAIPESCLADYPEAFKKKSTYREVHTILHYVKKDEPQGDAPESPEQDPQYARWEEPVQRWAQGQGYQNTKPKEGSCSLRSKEATPRVTFTNPDNQDTITSRAPTFSVEVVAPQDIVRVDFYIDDTLVGTAKNGKTAAVADLSDFTNGFTTLTAKATDEVQNVGTTSIDVNLLFTTSNEDE